jgi:hypothetical protein
MTWLNVDGLLVKFAQEEGAKAKGGTYSTLGALQCTEIKVDLTDLTSTAAIVGATGSAGVLLPGGIRIEEIEVVAETAATSGGAATLDIGLIDTDHTTLIDDDGFVVALALTAIDAAGEKNVLRVGSTGAGALVGTTTSSPGYLVASFNAAAYTAGKVVIRIYYYNPQTTG